MRNNVNNSTEKNVIEWARCGADLTEEDGTRCGADLTEEDGTRYGVPIGTPTVKELIAILSKLPEDYRVTCCGGENYLYFWPEQKSITIDNEWYLG